MDLPNREFVAMISDGLKMDERVPLLAHIHAEQEGASVRRTFANIIISILGSGVLGLPFAFKTSGWAVGSGTILLAGCLSYFCMVLLVKCKEHLVGQGKVHICTYSDLGAYTNGWIGRQLVEITLLISQIGCCVAYVIFIAHNLSSIFGTKGSYSSVVFLLVPFQIFLSWVRSLATLAPFSIFADTCSVLAMAIVIKDDIGSYKGFKGVQSYTNFQGLFFSLGMSVYCYEGFGMTLPLKASMKKPQKFNRTLGLSFVLITSVYLLFGFVGYLAFGEETIDIITLNLPNDWTTVAVKLGLCIALFFTFPVMMYPVYEILEIRLLTAKWSQELLMSSARLYRLLNNGLRGILVVVVALVAVSVPGFGVFISLVGSTVCAMLAFVFPAAFHLQIFGEKLSRLDKASDIFIILSGILFAAYGTYDAFARLFSL